MASQSDNPYKQAGPSFNESRGFLGIDLYTDPQDMNGGSLLVADNFVNRSAILHVRPGLRGMLGGGAPLSSSSSSQQSSSSSCSVGQPYTNVGQTTFTIPTGPVYELIDYVDMFGNTLTVFSVSAGADKGKLFTTQQGSGAKTELLDENGRSYNVVADQVDMARLGAYIYFIDGNSALRRLNLSGGFPIYAMKAPTTSPAVSLISRTLWQANSANNWSFDGQATAYNNILPNSGDQSQPQIVNGSNLRGNGWVITNESGPARGGYPNEVNIIDPNVNITLAGGSDVSGGFIAVPALSGNSALYPSRFHLQLWTVKNDFGSNPNTYSGLIIITPFDANHSPIGSAATVVINPGGNQSTGIDTVIDFSGLGPTVAALKIRIVNTNSNSVGNLYVGPISLVPISVQTQFITGPAAVTIIPTISGGAIVNSSSSSSSSPSSSSSFSSSAPVVQNPATDIGNVLDYQGTSFIFNFGAGDLSGINRLAISIKGVSSWVGVSWNLSIQQSAATGGAWLLAANGTFINTDQTQLDCDISTIPSNLLTSVQALKLTFIVPYNPVWTSPFYALQIGPISASGNLTIGKANYIWYLTETAIIDNANSIESNPSLPTSEQTPSFSGAEAALVLPVVCPENPSTNQYNWYRLGGVYSDVRLVASVNKNVSVPYGSDPANPYYGWDAPSRTFTDNTPDSYLALAALMSFSRDPMPANGQALAAWQGRLALGVGNLLYISWLYSADNSAPLMTTLVLNTDDPDLPTDGCWFQITPDTSDTIVRLVPFGTPINAGTQFGGGLVVLCKRSVWLVQGTDSSNFSVRQYPYTYGVGLIAFRGVARISPNELVFMGPDRLHIFPPNLDGPQRDLGLRIQPELYPVPPQTQQNAAAFAKSWMAFHDAKLLIGAPLPGDTQNSVVWVCDFRVGEGWTRLTGPTLGGGFTQPGMAMTSAVSLPPNSTSGAQFDLYFYGIDGQIYRSIDTIDVATPLSQPQAIPFTLTVNGLRPGFFYRFKSHSLYYMWAMLQRIEVDMVMNGLLTVTAQAFDVGVNSVAPVPIPGKVAILQYNLAGGGRPFDLNMPPGLIEGQLLEVTLSGSVGLSGDIAYCHGVRAFISGTTYERGA